MSTNPTWEKFQHATVTLARSAPIKDRLTAAYRNHLAGIEEDELPPPQRESFRSLCHALTREKPVLRGEDAFRATVRKMSCEEAEGIACSVVQIFSALTRSSPPVRVKPLAQVVPLFIAEA